MGVEVKGPGRQTVDRRLTQLTRILNLITGIEAILAHGFTVSILLQYSNDFVLKMLMLSANYLSSVLPMIKSSSELLYGFVCSA
jgi:hypothetical protein